MKKNRWMAGVLAGAMVLTLAGCGSKEDTTQEEEKTGTPVETQTVERNDIASENRVSGQVMASDEASIFSPLAVKVEKVYVKSGDHVKKGDVLFQLDADDIQRKYQPLLDNYNRTKSLGDAQLSQARQSVSDTQALTNSQVALAQKTLEDTTKLMNEQIKLAQDNYDHAAALLEIGAESQGNVDQAKSNLEQTKLNAQNNINQAQTALDQAKINAKSSVSQAELAVKSTQTSTESSLSQLQTNMDDILDSLDDTSVKATISGTVASVAVSEGSNASQQTAAVVITDVTTPEIVVAVSETLLPKLSIGDKATATISASSADPFETTITEISPTANQNTKLYDVHLAVPEDVDVTIGMFAEVVFQTDGQENTVVVPTESILTDDDGQYVFTVSQKKTAKKVPVTTGLVGNGVTEILTGLSGGEALVTSGQSYLSDKAEVRIVKSNDKSSKSTSSKKTSESKKSKTSGQSKTEGAGE
jgi:RND family efflux transporter MFP subunit